ncbi:T-cell immunoglobulin and mucin domain-containing protein 2 isoform X1 [Rattus norvegicus]|uniref:T-cell immunoglobulin and mucin domain-containing protein 2 n=3 Tax=Rattus norvegicus TaxID=10116 RepID=TIMD2_RAT|nr:T-cell immunoglobulin and mucin domain-containing protein 2 precursor [Rattus norvegicus]XP_006246230.1 T-cell immunoglobulin and mucin domain-containing protein 2 isoform X1 [Rattus norvegicus]XP_008765891.1 T-cell immunoglobulin and mucin domain-containing protein 2 isoform X1 [Rattus norvegicus]Q5FVR0.1 RecName: Full=T-cell immunoglobulin and mucin domain-containing protein 2; Short=TIMD-2; AltName: Full=T-cell immunoglobulin mucin receptor 2; Short=TIM-2; AltName: Full=T-cell membrane pro|eukprot:NP_001013877.1 T-cell immunoglobulin and mucin domain-containing protein 2 precursor [Rattus norvegicus]
MVQLQVFISGLLLLLPGAVASYTVVQGHSVTLPCIYSTTYRDEMVPTCWGRGECRSSYCTRSLIWTNGYKVTYQRSNRYQLKGNISEGNVSLTIENTVVSDSGPYCCIAEIPGAFYFVDYLLEVKAELPTSPPTRPTNTGRPTTTRPTNTGRPTTTRPTNTGRPTTTERPTTTGRPTTTERPTTTGRPTTISTRSTHVPTSTRVSTSTPPTPEQTQTHRSEATTYYPDQTTAEVTEAPSHTPTDWNNTATSSDDSWNSDTEAIPPQKLQRNPTKGFYVGMSFAALLLLLLASTVAITRYMVMRKNSGSLRFVAFPVSKIGASQNKVVEQARIEDEVYIIEDSPYFEEES